MATTKWKDLNHKFTARDTETPVTWVATGSEVEARRQRPARDRAVPYGGGIVIGVVLGVLMWTVIYVVWRSL